jgi:uncharacterized repeat protein (TIGR01451 family)
MNRNLSIPTRSIDRFVERIVFIDAALENNQQLITGTIPNAQVVVIEPEQDAIAQIGATLAASSDVREIHIVAHGQPGSLQLGSRSLNYRSLLANGDRIRQWATALAHDAEILLYGCRVAAGDLGTQFLEQLQQLTGATIAASSQLVGNAARGGNWQLDVSTGTRRASLAFDAATLATYPGVLVGPPSGSNVMYAVRVNGLQSELAVLDLETGTSTVVATLGAPTAAMARAEDGRIYYIQAVRRNAPYNQTIPASEARLRVYDPATGQDREVGTGLGDAVPPDTNFVKLAQASASSVRPNAIFALTQSAEGGRQLFQIDITTGRAIPAVVNGSNLITTPAGTPAFVGDSGDAAFDPNNPNRLFVNTRGPGGNMALYAIDIRTNVAQFIGETSLRDIGGSLAFGEDGNLYAVSGSRLYVLPIEPATDYAQQVEDRGFVGDFTDFATLPVPTPVVDLDAVKQTSVTSVSVGDTITYTITVTNNGGADGTPLDLAGIQVSDPIPAGIQVSPNDITAVITSGTGQVVSLELNGNQLTSELNLGYRATVVYTIRGLVTAAAPPVLDNTASVKPPDGYNLDDPRLDPGIDDPDTDRIDSEVLTPIVPNPPPIAQDDEVNVGVPGDTVLPALQATDPNGTVVSYRITQLPQANQGTLLLNGVSVQTGQQLTPEQIDDLVFRSPTGFGGATFRFTATDNAGAVSLPANVVLNPPSVPGNGNPGGGDVPGGDPGTGNPGTGNPGTGNPGTGNPGTGNPGTGNPGTGNPPNGGGGNTPPTGGGEVPSTPQPPVSSPPGAGKLPRGEQTPTGSSGSDTDGSDSDEEWKDAGGVTVINDYVIPRPGGNNGGTPNPVTNPIPIAPPVSDGVQSPLCPAPPELSEFVAAPPMRPSGVAIAPPNPLPRTEPPITFEEIEGTDGDDNLDTTNRNQTRNLDSGENQPPSREWIEGFDGNDTIQAGATDDLIAGDRGNDVSWGNDGSDVITGDEGDDAIAGDSQDLTDANFSGRDLIEGNEGNDSLYGNEREDVVAGGSGDDLAFGGKDNDEVAGDEGNDSLIGNFGDDMLLGSRGSSVSIGDAGDKDALYGNYGQDILKGGEGQDSLHGGKNDDLAYGGKDDDMVFGDWGNDTLSGDLGADTLVGSNGDPSNVDGEGRDYAFGGEGEDVLFGNAEADVLAGDSGDDRVHGGKHGDTIYGDEGSDELYGEEGDDVILGSLGSPVGIGDEGDRDMIAGNKGQDVLKAGEGQDSVYAGQGDDLVYGGKDDDTVMGDLGNDSLSGDLGDDVIVGGNGNLANPDTTGSDLLFGKSGNDWLEGNNGSDSLVSGEGNDTAGGGQNDDHLWGNAGDDLLFGDLGNDRICAGIGDDTLIGSNGTPGSGEDGRDRLGGADGNDMMYGNGADDILEAGLGNDMLHGGQGNDSLNGGDDDDLLFGDLGDDTLDGGDRNDTLVGCNGMSGSPADGRDLLAGGEGDDVVFGNEQDDILAGGGGNDALYGGKGNDTIAGEAGDDLLFGDLGNDVIFGGEGADAFVLGPTTGFDTIADFKVGVDTIALSGGMTFAQLTLTQAGDGAIVALGGALLAQVSGVQVSQLTASQFSIV